MRGETCFDFPLLKDNVSAIAQDAVLSTLEGSSYDHTKVNGWINRMTNACIDDLRKMCPNFKYMVTCFIRQKKGAGLEVVSTAYWDEKTDGTLALTSSMVSRRGKSSKNIMATVPSPTPPDSRRNSFSPSESRSSHDSGTSDIETNRGTLPPPVPLNDALEPKTDCAIKVVVRVRPLSEKELLARSPVVVNVTRSSIQVINPCLFTDSSYLDAISTPARRASITNIPMSLTATALKAAQQAGECRTFHFDRCFGVDNAAANESEPFACAYDIDFTTQRPNQELIFEEIGKDIIPATFQGFNTTVLAYGQTGSGKTHTMVGERTMKGNKGGIIPRVCEALFHGIEARKAKEQQEYETTCEPNVKRTVYTVQMSYCEIYKEKVHDLLDGSALSAGGLASPSSRDSSETSSIYRHGRTLKVREHPLTGPFVEGLSTRLVGSYEEISEEMAAGDRLRTVAATVMNATSSRSHAVFSITLTQTVFDGTTQLTTAKTSKISMIDLAGSERANVSGTTGDRLKEGAMINKSLTTLGRVISALSKSSSERVPYRDSTLTWLLKESLGGNAKTTMMAMISPAAENYEETMSTLRYAESAKKVINRAVINEDPNARIIRQLREEITQLRQELTRRESEAFYLVENLKDTAQVPPDSQVREEFYQAMQDEMNQYKTQVTFLIQQQQQEQEKRDKASKIIRLHEEYPSLVNEHVKQHASMTSRDVVVFCLGDGTSFVGTTESSLEMVVPSPISVETRVTRTRSWSFLKRRKSMADKTAVVDTPVDGSSGLQRSKSMSPRKTRSFLRRKTSDVNAEDETNKVETTEVVTNCLELREVPSFPGQILPQHAIMSVTKRDEEHVEEATFSYEYIVEIQPFNDTAVVWINGQRVSERSRVYHGDLITFGQAGIHRFRLHIPQVARMLAAKEDEVVAHKALVGLNLDNATQAEARVALQSILDQANRICTQWDVPMSFSFPFSTGPSLEEEPTANIIVTSQVGVDKHGEPLVTTMSWTKEHLVEQMTVWKQMTSSLEATMTKVAHEQAEFGAHLLDKQEQMRIHIDEEYEKLAQKKLALTREVDLLQEKAQAPVLPMSTSTDKIPIHTEKIELSSPPPQYIRLLGQSRIALSGLLMTPDPLNEPKSLSAAIYDTAGHQIARMLCTLSVIATTTVETSAKGPAVLSPLRRGLSQLTKSRPPKDEEVVVASPQWTIQVVIDHIEVVESATASQSVSLTIKKWKTNDTDQSATVESTPKVEIDSQRYPIHHRFTTTTRCEENLLFELWGYGDMIPPKTWIQQPLTTTQHEFFVSVDMEEREQDGLFRPVTVKSDGTLRLHINQPRRVNVRITQADRLPLILHDIALVQFSPATLVCGAANLSVTTGKATQQLVYPSVSVGSLCVNTAMEAATMDLDHLPVYHDWPRLVPRGAAEIDVASRSLHISLRWEPSHGGKEVSSDEGESEPLVTEVADPEDTRSVFRIVVSFQTTLSPIPIVLSKSIVTKRSTIQLTNTQRLVREWESTKSVWWAKERFSRAYRLGTWYSVDIISSSENLREQQSSVVSQQAVQEYINGIRRLEVVFAMERVRQEIVLCHATRNDGQPGPLTMELAQQYFESILQSKAQEADPLLPSPVVRVVQLEDEGVPYLRHKANRDIFVAIESGVVLDMSKAPHDVEEEGPSIQQHITHFVSEPTQLGGDTSSEMCGYLMFSTTLPLDETASGAAPVAPLNVVDTTKPSQPRNLWAHARETIHNHLAWDRRWVVLKRPFLYVYKTFAKKEQVGVLDISKCQLVVPPTGPSENSSGPMRRRSSLFNNSNMQAPLLGFQLVSMIGTKCVVWSLQASATAEMRAWLVAIDPLKIQAREAVVSNVNAIQSNNNSMAEGTVITA